MTSGKVLIVAPKVTTYRVPFFDRLAVLLADRGFDFEVLTGSGPPSLESRHDDATGPWVRSVPTRWWPIAGREVANRRIGEALTGPALTLVVVEHALHNLESWNLLCSPRHRDLSVAMWGHGGTYSKRQGRLEANVKKRLTNRCDWFFAYTDRGARAISRDGFPEDRISVINNAIDTMALRTQWAAVSDDELRGFRSQHRIVAGRTALYLGGVDRAKGIGYLLDAAHAARSVLAGFRLLIAGDGDHVPDVIAAEMAGAPVTYLGRLEGREKALALRAADVMAVPTRVGLVALDALVAGIPLVCLDDSWHGPEADYLASALCRIDVNGPAVAYGAALAGVLVDTDVRATCASAGPRAAQELTIDRMAERFAEGLVTWSDTAKRPRR